MDDKKYSQIECKEDRGLLMIAKGHDEEKAADAKKQLATEEARC